MSFSTPSSPGQNTQAVPFYFRCVNGCAGKYSVYQVMYRCPNCDGLLEVHHELEPLRKMIPYKWQQLFDSRAATTTWPYGSGVWAFREWLIPDLQDDNIVSMCEGNSNLFWADRLGKQLGLPELWIKLCGNSHTGSFKDLGMTVLVSVVKQMMRLPENSVSRGGLCQYWGHQRGFGSLRSLCQYPSDHFFAGRENQHRPVDSARGQWRVCDGLGYGF